MGIIPIYFFRQGPHPQPHSLLGTTTNRGGQRGEGRAAGQQRQAGKMPNTSPRAGGSKLATGDRSHPLLQASQAIFLTWKCSFPFTLWQKAVLPRGWHTGGCPTAQPFRSSPAWDCWDSVNTDTSPIQAFACLVLLTGCFPGVK